MYALEASLHTANECPYTSIHTSTCKQDSFPVRKEAPRCRRGMLRAAGRCRGLPAAPAELRLLSLTERAEGSSRAQREPPAGIPPAQGTRPSSRPPFHGHPSSTILGFHRSAGCLLWFSSRGLEWKSSVFAERRGEGK